MHGDLKPGMLNQRRHETPRLRPRQTQGADRGRADGGAPTQSAGLTVQETILGTFRYMAPEQLDGKEADVRTES